MIVVNGASLTSPLVGKHLDRLLSRDVIRKWSRQIAPASLQLATFADLERILPYSSAVSISRMLETANVAGPQAGNFRQRARRSLIKIHPGKDLIKERWHSLTKEMLHLFPE